MVKAGVKFDEIILGNITSMKHRQVLQPATSTAARTTSMPSKSSRPLGVPMVIQLTPQNNPEKFTA